MWVSAELPKVAAGNKRLRRRGGIERHPVDLDRLGQGIGHGGGHLGLCQESRQIGLVEMQVEQLPAVLTEKDVDTRAVGKHGDVGATVDVAARASWKTLLDKDRGVGYAFTRRGSALSMKGEARLRHPHTLGSSMFSRHPAM